MGSCMYVHICMMIIMMCVKLVLLLLLLFMLLLLLLLLFQASGGQDKVIHVWDVKTNVHVHTFSGHRDTVSVCHNAHYYC